MHLYKNCPHLTFDDAKRKKPDQIFDVVSDSLGEAHYQVKVNKFNSVTHLSFFFPDSEGEETSKLYYIGMRGHWEKATRNPIVITNYELAANPADHKNKLYESNSTRMGH